MPSCFFSFFLEGLCFSVPARGGGVSGLGDGFGAFGLCEACLCARDPAGRFRGRVGRAAAENRAAAVGAAPGAS